ncbi:MAG TPA: CPBP family intramembrane glutamic endopeptidase [Euzebyales bacterium]
MYVVIAYVVTWLAVAPLAAAGLGATGTSPPLWLHAFGAAGPAVGAAVVFWRTGGRTAVADLWRRTTDVRRIHGVWWLLALSPLVLAVVVLAVVAPFGAIRSPRGPVLLAGVGVSLAYGIFEEIGWRGFLLPRLQDRHTAITSAGWVFVVWAGWHVPMFAYRLPGGVLALGWLVGLYFGSVWMTVLHNGTGGSVLACAVWHVGYNLASTSGAELSPSVPAAVTTLVVVGTLVAVRWTGVTDLTSGSRFTIDAHGRPGASAGGATDAPAPPDAARTR